MYLKWLSVSSSNDEEMSTHTGIVQQLPMQTLPTWILFNPCNEWPERTTKHLDKGIIDWFSSFTAAETVLHRACANWQGSVALGIWKKGEDDVSRYDTALCSSLSEGEAVSQWSSRPRTSLWFKMGWGTGTHSEKNAKSGGYMSPASMLRAILIRCWTVVLSTVLWWCVTKDLETMINSCCGGVSLYGLCRKWRIEAASVAIAALWAGSDRCELLAQSCEQPLTYVHCSPCGSSAPAYVTGFIGSLLSPLNHAKTWFTSLGKDGVLCVASGCHCCYSMWWAECIIMVLWLISLQWIVTILMALKKKLTWGIAVLLTSSVHWSFLMSPQNPLTRLASRLVANVKNHQRLQRINRVHVNKSRPDYHITSTCLCFIFSVISQLLTSPIITSLTQGQCQVVSSQRSRQRAQMLIQCELLLWFMAAGWLALKSIWSKVIRASNQPYEEQVGCHSYTSFCWHTAP